jgi:hypothetical protein
MKTILTSSGPRRIATYRTATIAGLNVLVHPAVLPRTGEVCTDPRTGLSYGGGPAKVRSAVAHLGLESVRDFVAGHEDAPAPTDDIPVAEQWSGGKAPAKHDVAAVAAAIARHVARPEWDHHIRKALSSRTGRLLAKSPADDIGKAVWNGLQPNPWKVQIGACCFLRGEAAEILAHLASYSWPAWLDADAKALQDLGVWR